MEWQVLVALVLAIPIILFPAAFVWYLNLSGLWEAVKHRIKAPETKKIAALEERR